MANIKAILTEQVKDTPTILSIKDDTTKILNTLNDNKRALRYGFRIKKSESSPSNRVEYILDAVGMKPAKMDYAKGTFDYGSWKDVWFVRENYPVMVKFDGIEDYRLNPDDYSKKLNGDPSDYTNEAYGGNAMSAIPTVWVKRYEDAAYEYVVVCEIQYDESYKAYAHTRSDGSIAPVAYHAMFKGYIDTSGKLRSLGGKAIGCNTNANTEVEAAKKNATGVNYNIQYYSMWQLINDLLTLMSKTEDSETAFGNGQITGYSAEAPNQGKKDSGGLYNKGQFFGSNTQTDQVKVFHMEDWWGNRWDRMIGLTQRYGIYSVKMTPEGSGYNLTGAGYEEYPYPAPAEGWQKDTHTHELGRLPTTVGASSSTHICDYFWINSTYDGVFVALCGGVCNDGVLCGSRCLGVNALASQAAWHIGASLTLV